MSIGSAFLLIATAGILFLWVWAAYKAYSQGQTNGLVLYLFNLIGAIGLVAILWLLLVLPYTDCTEWQCGFQALLLWIILCIVVMVIWPLIVITVINRRFPKPEKIRKVNEQILDDSV